MVLSYEAHKTGGSMTRRQEVP